MENRVGVTRGSVGFAGLFLTISADVHVVSAAVVVADDSTGAARATALSVCLTGYQCTLL